jgi:hypothetical protein
MPISDPEKNREYQRNWARNKKAGLPTRQIRTKMPAEERQRRRRLAAHQWEKDIRRKRDEVFGTECKICGAKKEGRLRMFLHKKDGQSHKCCSAVIRQALQHPEDWIRLCGKCHDGVHFCMKWLGLTWDEIWAIVKKPRG